MGRLFSCSADYLSEHITLFTKRQISKEAQSVLYNACLEGKYLNIHEPKGQRLKRSAETKTEKKKGPESGWFLPTYLWLNWGRTRNCRNGKLFSFNPKAKLNRLWSCICPAVRWEGAKNSKRTKCRTCQRMDAFATEWETDNRVESENKYRHLNRERKQEMEWQIAIYFLELLPRLETFWNLRVFALDYKTLSSDFCVLFDLLQLTWPYYPSRKVTYFQLRILYFPNPRYAKDGQNHF